MVASSGSSLLPISLALAARLRNSWSARPAVAELSTRDSIFLVQILDSNAASGFPRDSFRGVAASRTIAIVMIGCQCFLHGLE
jgi:hypothetical protein